MNIDQFSYLKNTISKNNISEEIYNNSKLSSVGVLFRSNNNQHEIMLIKRSKRLRTHPGEWAFPGGKIENNDNNLRDTFFRELKEEVGIEKKYINLIGRIKSFVTTTGYIVVPYIGILKEGYKLSTKDSVYDTKKKILSSNDNSIFTDEDGNYIETSMFQYNIKNNLFSSIGKIKIIDIKKK